MRNPSKLVFSSILLAMLLAFKADTPQKITWETLSDITFNKIWSKKDHMFLMVPRFGPKIVSLKNKPIEITGYVIPIDVETQNYVLSANPFSACFFCGGAGPESVISLKFKAKPRRFNTDERLAIHGILELNDTNFEELNYILTQAELVGKK